MNLRYPDRYSRITVIALLLFWTQAALGQAFSSGSTGADGPLNAVFSQSITVRPGGVYNYTTVNINSGVTLTYVPGDDNAPVVILATGDVTITGAINVNGVQGTFVNNTTPPTIGARGGPGGFAGGNGSIAPSLSSGGHGPGGGQPANAIPSSAQRGVYGAPQEFVSLIPLFGGSGGAGGGTTTNSQSGGGGGGAILIASSSRITINGTIFSNGGNTAALSTCTTGSSSPGSGGAIRLVAPQILGTGQLLANGGLACVGGVAGGGGKIRLEAAAMNFTGSTSPLPSTSLTLGPVSPVGNPVLANVPTLAITSIGGQSLPPTTGASYFVPDITLPLETTNPVPVAVVATNTPVGAPTAIAVRLLPQLGTWTDVPVTNQSGSFASSTGSADVTFPVGRISVVQAIASFTLTGQTASLFPLIDGEQVERVMVAASPGAPSTLSLVTQSGRQVKLDELRAEDRIRVALAWETMKEARN